MPVGRMRSSMPALHLPRSSRGSIRRRTAADIPSLTVGRPTGRVCAVCGVPLPVDSVFSMSERQRFTESRGETGAQQRPQVASLQGFGPGLGRDGADDEGPPAQREALRPDGVYFGRRVRQPGPQVERVQHRARIWCARKLARVVAQRLADAAPVPGTDSRSSSRRRHRVRSRIASRTPSRRRQRASTMSPGAEWVTAR